MKKIFLTLLILLNGCKSIDTSNNLINLENLDNANKVLIDSNKNIISENLSIQSNSSLIILEANNGLQKHPEAKEFTNIINLSNLINVSCDKIKESVKNMSIIEIDLNKLNNEIKDINEKIDASTSNNEELKKQIEQKDKEILECKDDIKRKHQMIWVGVSAFSALMMVIGVLLAVFGSSPKTGISLTISSMTLSGISYFMSQYVFLIAIIGGIIFVGSFLYTIYVIQKHRKGLEEVVPSFEAVKNKDWTTSDVKDEVNKLQSPQTKELIKEIKTKQGLV